MLLTNSDDFKSVVETIKIIRRSQKKQDYYNYYIYPKLVIKIETPEIVACNQKYLILKLTESHESVKVLLDIMNSHFNSYIKNNFNTGNKVMSHIHYQDTVKCHFPPNKLFNLKNTESINVELHNIWETGDKIGYHFVVESTKYASG